MEELGAAAMIYEEAERKINPNSVESTPPVQISTILHEGNNNCRQNQSLKQPKYQQNPVSYQDAYQQDFLSNPNTYQQGQQNSKQQNSYNSQGQPNNRNTYQ